MDEMKDLAMIYGILLGNGCLSKGKKSYTISITCNIHSDLPLMEYILLKIEMLRKKKVIIHKRPNYGKVEINFSDKNLFHKFKNLGFPVGKKGVNLKIPEFFSNYLKYVIAGYFATDGCLIITNNNGTIYPRIEFSSISKLILEQTKSYLESNDILGNVYISHKNNFRSDKPLFRLQINGKSNLLKFWRKIGFVNPKHHEKFNHFKKSNIK